MSETRGMAQYEVTRTLVKSQPEVWTQCSDADSLGRHLSGPFGEIRITRLDPEHSVAWEGEEVSGTVRIEPSAWGTRVTLAVEMADEIAALEQEASPLPTGPEPAPAQELAPEPPTAPESEPADVSPAEPPSPEPGMWIRFRARFRRQLVTEPFVDIEADADAVPESVVSAAPEPVAEEPAEPEALPERPDADSASRSDTAALLTAALESLGQAHHRPFSRA